MTPKIQAERIMVIRFRMIGDVLLDTPVVRALRQHYPKSHITFLTEPPEPQHGSVMLRLPCQPCGQVYCGPPLNIACLRTLSAERVFAAIQAHSPCVPKLQRLF